jgi:molecular chaperone GrpE
MPADPTAPTADTDGLDVQVEVDATSSAPEDGAGGPPPETAPVDRVAELEAQVAKLEQEKKDNYDRFLRAAADLENHRRRTKRDLDDARAEARTRVLKEMLPVVDNLERGLTHAEEAAKVGDHAAIVDGLRLVLRQFNHAFERSDVTAVDAQGQPFDPNLHEAISQVESADQPPGTVVSVLQRGYKLGDRLLRPALVVVAKPPAAPAGDESAGDAGSGEPQG